MPISLAPPSPAPAPDAAARTPATEEELTTTIRACLADRQPFLTEGRGTKRHHGPAPGPAAARISLARLDRVTAYEAGDLVVSVQAGVRIEDLQRALGEHSQWLPLDPPHADATIGGILATASAGPRRLGYGGPKDHLLGLRTLGATGGVTKSGGRVVKNVTGYDLHKLQVGGFGTLGVLIEAHFKVAPRPAVSGALIFGCEGLEAAHRLLLDAMAERALRPVALEAVDGAAREALRAGAPDLLPDAPALAIIGVEGSRLVFDRHVRELTRRPDGAGPPNVIEGADARRLWAAFRDAPARRPGDVVVRVAARPHDLPGLLGALALGRAGAAGVAIQAGNGVARVRLQAGDNGEIGTAGTFLTTLTTWQAEAQRRDGYAIVEAAPLALAGRDRLPWSLGPNELGARLKRAFDPHGLINAGRLAL